MTEDTKLVEVSAKRRPPRAGMGRPKGIPNKLTRTLKQAIEESFEKVGGAEYLARMAVEQPAAYMTLLGKIIPQQVDANVTGKVGMPEIVLAMRPSE